MQSLGQRWKETTLANKLNVVATFMAAVAAVASVCVTVMQWERTKDQRTARDRPFTLIQEFRDVSRSERYVEHPWFYELAVKNVGTSVSRDTIFKCQGASLENHRSNPPTGSHHSSPNIGAELGWIAAQQEIVFFRPLSDFLTDAEVEGLRHGGGWANLYGEIDYSDDEGHPHHTSVCLQILKDDKLDKLVGQRCEWPHGGDFAD